jgi:hypothetical protein
MKRKIIFLALLFTISIFSNLFGINKLQKSNILKDYNVVWRTPSTDAWESMPLSGRFGAGANVWVQDGALWLYLAHNMAYDEEGRLMKLGALRITPSNAVFNNLTSFKQELDLASGAIFINALSKSGARLKMKLWFADENLIIESTSKQKTTFEISFGTWRDKIRDSIYIDMGKRLHTLRPDDVNMSNAGIVWNHSNANYASTIANELKKQSISPESITNPALNNVFGGAVVCNRPLSPKTRTAANWQLWKGASWSMITTSDKSHIIVVALRAGKNRQPSTWMSEASSLLEPKSLKLAAIKEAKRWNEFWSRSYININKDKKETDAAWVVGRNYQLFRYMLATNQNGQLPLLFNGGIFTTDNFDKIKDNNNNEISRKRIDPSTPDLRHWLFCGFMAQNQRWLGWPTILAGDADLLEPSNAFYRMHAASAASRAKGLGAEGVVYPEALQVWGLTWYPTPTGQCGAAHLKYAFAMMLENAWMALHGHTTLGKDISGDMEWIKGTVRFFDSYYRNETKRLTGNQLDSTGRLSIFPANSIELLVGAKNPIEVVAGLQRITGALTKLPDTLISANEKKYFSDLLCILPELPVGEKDGIPILKPAFSWEKEYNMWELPELYVAWPYRIKGVSHPGTAQIAQNTWDLLPKKRADKVTRDYSWMPVVVNMAAMGNTSEAAKRILAKLGNFNPQARFPAFFGPGHDWVPDHNWGGSGMVGLQEMLMAADPYSDGKIFLLPAWPVEWNVDFKLHAPQQTVIEASVKNGKVVSLKVTPESRRKDIVLNSKFRM